MSAFLQPTYWLTMNPPEVGGLLGSVTFVVFVFVFILGIVGHLVADRRGSDRFMREVGHKIATLFVVMGLLGVLLFFFSFEEIRLFGARFWYLVWAIGLLMWVFLIFRYVKWTVPTMRERETLRHANQKYLPGRKKK
ncbi:hypothetical protein HZA87_01450 [Candidatus Uhrbacteria bacterium]|nr:hypothetical protein [Candidatus Uhrbacteria bacterium]